MAIDNGVALIRATYRLIDPLRIKGDHFLRSRKELEECLQIGLGQTTDRGHIRERVLVSPNLVQGGREPVGMPLNKVQIRCANAMQMPQQRVKQR